MLRILALLSLLIASPAFAQFSNLTVTPTHPTAGLKLDWTGPGGTININRWTDAAPTPVTINTTTGMTYTDTTPVVNTIYYYSVSQGAASSNTFNGVVSDITQAFNCPPMVAIDPSMLGVDRTETFTAADGTNVSFTVHAPNSAIVTNPTNIRTIPPCNGAGGCSDFNNINTAILQLASTGGTVQLQAGDYHLNNGPGATGTGLVYPTWSGTPGIFDFNIGIFGNSDLVLAGANVTSGTEPTTRILFNQMPNTNYGFPPPPPPLISVWTVTGLAMQGNRQLVRNITFEWDFPTAIPGVLTNDTPTNCIAFIGVTNCQRFTVTNPTYYVPDPTHPPALYVVDAYNFTGRTYELHAGGRGGGFCNTPLFTCAFNPNFSVDGLYFYSVSPTLNSTQFPDNTTAIALVRTAGSLQPGTDAFDISFENTRLYSGGGPGLIQGAHSKGLRLSNFVIERKPDALLQPGEQPHYVSIFGDSDSNGSQGSVLIENSQFGYVEDDTYFLRGAVFQLQKLISTSSFTMDAGIVINHSPPGPNDFFKFMDPYSYKQIGTMPLVSWTKSACSVPRQCKSGTLWNFTFQPVPELAPYIGLPANLLPWFGEPAWSAPNFAIRNSCSHDTHGRILANTWNGLVENNVMGNGYFGPLSSQNYFSQPGLVKSFGDGPGGQNIIFRNNKVIGAAYGQTDLRPVWSPPISNGFPQTGWGTAAAILIGDAVGADGFYPPAGTAMKDFVIENNFISNTPGLCIMVSSTTHVVVNGNICVDANQIAFTSGFDATFCEGLSQGWQLQGVNQPWCLGKGAAQGSIALYNDVNVDTTTTPNVFLGTSIGTIFTFDSSTVMRNDIIVGPLHVPGD